MAWLPLRTTRKPLAHLNEEDFEGDEELAMKEDEERKKIEEAKAAASASAGNVAKAAATRSNQGAESVVAGAKEQAVQDGDGLAVYKKPEDLGKATADGKSKLAAARKLGVHAR